MRAARSIAVAALATALVFSMASPALARPYRRWHRSAPPFRITAPSLVSDRVTTGSAFDATGVVVPAFTADDTSTVSIDVYGSGMRRGAAPIQSVAAALSASPDTGTAYAATLTIADPGEYLLVACVTSGGRVVVRSRPREVRVVLPYKVSRPHVLSAVVATGTAFDATGSVMPGIAADDAVTQVSVLVFSVGHHQEATEVASFAAVVTGDVTNGSTYDATVSLDTPGRYMLVAVVTQDGVVVGRSNGRPILVGTPVNDRHGWRGAFGQMMGRRG